MRYPLFGPSHFYDPDLPLARKLGLKLDVEFAPHEWTELGEVVGYSKDDPENVNYRVRVSVMAMPAQFWRFDVIQPFDGKPVRLETGSGSLSKYWPVAEQFAEGMIGAEPIPETALPQPSERP